MIPIDNMEKNDAPQSAEELKTEPETAEQAQKETVSKPEGPSAPAEGKKKESAKEKRTAKKEAEKAEKEAAAAAQELAVLNDKYLRVCAEYDNFRKRSQKEKDALYGDIKANVITAFLPVYDNLVRALAVKTEDEAYSKGVEMIMTQFNATLEKLGVEEIPALGEKFNPELHNAVMHVDEESAGENEIVEVFQKGFKAGDKIIRFAMVKVAN